MGNSFLKVTSAVILSTIFAFSIRYALGAYLRDGTPFIFFFISIIISAWYGGFRGGIVATVLAALLSDYYFLPPFGNWTVGNESGQLLQLSIFIVCGILISYAGSVLLKERERVENLLKKMERSKDRALDDAHSLTVLTESLPSIVLSISSNRHITIANKLVRDWFNLNTDIVGKPFFEVFQGTEFESLKPAINAGFAGNQQSFDLLVNDHKQAERHLHLIIVPVPNDDKPVEQVILLGSDITERIQNIKAVEKSEMEFRTIFELAGSGKFELDLNTYRFLRANRKFCAITGYDKEELLKLSIFDLLPLENREERMIAFRSLLLSGEREWNLEWQFLRKNKNLFWANITGAILFSNGKPVRSISTVQDTTGRKEIELELELEKTRAEEASLAKSAFLANMSHEIRTPLGAMLGFTQIILDSAELNEETKKQLLIVSRNGQHLFRLVNELLDISKIEANKMEIEEINFNLEELLTDVTSLFSAKAKEKGLLFEIKSQATLPAEINSDSTRIRQILANLIGNAVKFTERGAIKIELLSEPIADAPNTERLIFKIIDTGPGIPKEKQDLLFKPFSQAEASTTRKHGGTGLGLYLSKRMAEALGGTLTFHSGEQSHGSVFSLVLTVNVTAGSNRFSLNSGENQKPSLSYTKKTYDRIDGARVLVVDDVEDNLHLARLYLRASGAEVDTSLSAADAFDKIEGNDYDIVFMDIQMPVMDGYNAIKILRNKGVKLPIIALTAHSMKGERERCLKAGFTGYLSKPVDRTLMIGNVKHYFHPRNSQQLSL